MKKLNTSLSTQDLAFTTKDKVSISATFVPANQLKAPGLILLHQLGRERSTYLPLFEPLHQAGFALLAIDLRGHGDSTRAGDKSLNWEDFKPQDWQNMSLDVDAAIDTLIKQRGVLAEQIGVVGASIGANLALLALHRNSNLQSGVLLSPGLDYRSISLETVRDKPIKQKLLIIAARDDEYSHESSEALSHNFGPDTLYVIEGETHGTDLLIADPQVIPLIVEHFRKSLKTF